MAYSKLRGAKKRKNKEEEISKIAEQDAFQEQGKKVVDQLLVATLVVLLHNAEVSHRCGYGSSNMQGLAISNLSSSPL